MNQQSDDGAPENVVANLYVTWKKYPFVEFSFPHLRFGFRPSIRETIRDHFGDANLWIRCKGILYVLGQRIYLAFLGFKGWSDVIISWFQREH
jgi:hypothetical protein